VTFILLGKEGYRDTFVSLCAALGNNRRAEGFLFEPSQLSLAQNNHYTKSEYFGIANSAIPL
jgi:hypothetical protein